MQRSFDLQFCSFFELSNNKRHAGAGFAAHCLTTSPSLRSATTLPVLAVFQHALEMPPRRVEHSTASETRLDRQSRPLVPLRCCQCFRVDVCCVDKTKSTSSSLRGTQRVA